MLTWLQTRRRVSGRWLSLAMLVTLHFALWAGVESIWSRPMLFTHLGLFLLWQPLWRGDGKLSTRSAVIIVASSVVALWWLNWWMLAFWVSGLFSLVGGRVLAFQGAWQRVRSLLVMGYLLSLLLFWLTPQLFMLPIAEEARRNLMEVVLPLLLLVIVFVPYKSEEIKKAVAVDLIYSLLLFMLITLVVLGSLAFMTLGRVDYFQALMGTLFVMALLLFILGWVWNPHLGFSGFQTIFLRYFLNIGTPFEVWINQLARTAKQEPSPATFLVMATSLLAEQQWLTGVKWECDEGKGTQGENSPYFIEVTDQDLHLILFTRQRVAPSVMMHINLLSQMLAYFYHSKRREQRLREMARLQAVHETGARLTHDLKNMLQSLFALISIADQQPSQAQPILRQQLPVLAQRIEMTLGKLHVPKHEEEATMKPLDTWWSDLQQRQQYRNLKWSGQDKLDTRLIPYTLFDSIADNLIENARNKRLRENDISVLVSLTVEPVRLSVCDTGSEITPELAVQLMHTVVESEDGLGVGLFQAARWAEQLGYQLLLRANLKGKVCFELVENKKINE